MQMVTENQLQGVSSWGQLQRGLGLTFPKMPYILSQGFIQGRKFFVVHQQMMMPGSRLINPGRDNSHALETEHDGNRVGNDCTILGGYDVDNGVRWR